MTKRATTETYTFPLLAFGKELRRRRQTFRMSQSKLAKRAGTSQTAVANIEAGRGNPSIDLLNRLAHGVSGAELRLMFQPPDHTKPKETKPLPEWFQA